MRNIEHEPRDWLIDTAPSDVIFWAARQTGFAEAVDRLSQQAYGDADRLRGAAEQLRCRQQDLRCSQTAPDNDVTGRNDGIVNQDLPVVG